ncbi:hypothetical protein DFJ66_8434 [Saccharothrix variisporea]|uniref:Uncharacterized protein n=2 Tax=Saccharothrix variisporea TaxID=543527 RepID=A0A495XLR1_9PSEU|nr:hypothetical protein DFJ66_8434 [Saccharothrix variisporea]
MVDVGGVVVWRNARDDRWRDRVRSPGYDGGVPLRSRIGNRAFTIAVQRGLIGDSYRFQVKRARFLALLAGTPEGRHALQVRDDHGITLSWVDGGAASYDGESRCTLNLNMDAGRLAGYFVHEMHHVERKKSGASPDADASPDEKQYVDRMVGEEIEGTVLGFQSRIGQPGPLMPGEEFYRIAHRDARDQALRAGADATAAEGAGRAAGRRAVEQLIRPSDGSWPRIAPNTFESYEMYYHRVWRKSHQVRR